MRRISKEGLDLLKKGEGLRLHSYQDIGGMWTIGYGHTNSAGQYDVSPDMEISEEDANRFLLTDLSMYEECVDQYVKVPLTDNQFSALVSFCYNVGTRNFIKSTLLKRLNKGQYDAVPNELKRWNKVKGKASKGLSNRRKMEIDLWGENTERTSQIVQDDKKTKNVLNMDILTSVMGSLSGLGGVLSGNGVVQYAFAAIMVFTAVMAVIIIYKRMEGTKR